MPDAPMPAMRYKSGPGNRRCDCGGTLVLKSVTRTSHNGIPTGIEYGYECEHCGKKLTLDNAIGIIMNFLVGALLGLIAWLLLTAVKGPRWRWGGGILFGLLALMLVRRGITCVATQARHPELPSNLL